MYEGKNAGDLASLKPEEMLVEIEKGVGRPLKGRERAYLMMLSHAYVHGGRIEYRKVGEAQSRDLCFPGYLKEIGYPLNEPDKS